MRRPNLKAVLLTLLLLMAVAAVVVPARTEIWFAVVYTAEPIPPPWGAGEGSAAAVFRFRKARAWLPGRESLVPDQTCGTCLADGHDRCLSSTQMLDEVMKRIGIEPIMGEGDVRVSEMQKALDKLGYSSAELGYDSDYFPITWHCTCPDPVHDWNE